MDNAAEGNGRAYVSATRRMISVRDICQIAFEHVSLEVDDYLMTSLDTNAVDWRWIKLANSDHCTVRQIDFAGMCKEEQIFDNLKILAVGNRRHMEAPPQLSYPVEFDLLDDTSEAKWVYGWKAMTTNFAEMICEMVGADVDRVTVRALMLLVRC